MKKTTIWLSALFLMFLSLTAMSRTCDRDEYDKAEYLSIKAGKILVNKYGGGRDIRVSMTSCEFNSYSGIFKTNIGVYWNGKIFSDNSYNIDGEITMKSDGSGVEFSQTYANEAVQDLDFWRGAFAGAVLLGTIASENGTQ